MTSDSFFELFVSQLRLSAKEQMKTLAQGSAENYSDYKFSCGFIAGLDHAERIFEEAIRLKMGEDK